MPSQIIEILEAIVAFILVIAIGYGVWLYKDRQYQKLNTEYTQLIEQSEQLALQHSKELAANKESADKEKDEAIKRNTVAYQSLVNSLRNRQDRPSNLSSNPNSQSTCTGTQLYREDAEFLAGEAARADQAIIDRDYYYEQYESVRRTLNQSGTDARQSGKVSDTKPLP